MKRMIRLTLGIALLGAGAVHAQGTLDAVQKKGFVQCGVNVGLAGFSQPDSRGAWKGLDVDVCRAIAAAVFGDSNKVRYTPTTAVQRFPALQGPPSADICWAPSMGSTSSHSASSSSITFGMARAMRKMTWSSLRCHG